MLILLHLILYHHLNKKIILKTTTGNVRRIGAIDPKDQSTGIFLGKTFNGLSNLISITNPNNSKTKNKYIC